MRKSFLMLLLFASTVIVGAQDPKQDFADGEFFLAAEEYEEALYTYNKVYKKGYQDNANINYRIGICLLQIPGRKTEAIPYLEKAILEVSEKYSEGSLKEENAPPDAHLYLGNSYRINMEFEKACEQYRLFDEYVGTGNDIQTVYAEQQIISCSNAVVAINNPVDVSIGNLGQLMETHRETYNLIVSADMNTMAFMGKNPFYRGIYVSRKDGNIWSKPMGINPSVVSEGNMDVVALSPDGNTMLLAVSDEFSSNIYMSKYENNRWNEALSMGKPINSRFYESYASFSPDMKSIFFTSNRQPEYAVDVYRSDLQEDGTWSDPVPLGEGVNTPLNEETPVLSADGKRIYFSSQGHNSIGGFDIFYSELQEDGTWGQAQNMGYPLNTTDDDFNLSPTGIQEDGTAYVFANAGKDQHPLFKFELIEPSATPVPVPFEEAEEELAEEPPGDDSPDEGGATEGGATDTTEPEAAEPEAVAAVEPSGPDKYLVRPIFFDFDNSEVNTAAGKELDHLAQLMQSFENLQIEITGHTDAVGTWDYNKRLSVRRAKATAKYLEKKGIASDRLKITGKSENEHVARNRTRDNKDAPDGRKLNRRVQFYVTSTIQVIIEMEPIDVPEHLRIQE